MSRKNSDSARQDRIKIANETLSALLLEGSENPLQHHVSSRHEDDHHHNTGEQEDTRRESETDMDEARKVYVDWPENDDDQYRFVSSRVEDYPDDITNRLSPKPYDSLDDAPEQRAIVPIKEVSAEPIRPVPVAGPSAASITSKHSQPRSDHQLPSNVTPMPEPPRYREIYPLANLDRDEQELLAEEEEYQNALKQRLNENVVLDNHLDVPPLDLNDMDKSEDFGQGDMIEISVRSTSGKHMPPQSNYLNDPVDRYPIEDSQEIPQGRMPAGVAKLSDFVDSLDADSQDRWEDAQTVLPYEHRLEYSKNQSKEMPVVEMYSPPPRDVSQGGRYDGTFERAPEPEHRVSRQEQGQRSQQSHHSRIEATPPVQYPESRRSPERGSARRPPQSPSRIPRRSPHQSPHGSRVPLRMTSPHRSRLSSREQKSLTKKASFDNEAIRDSELADEERAQELRRGHLNYVRDRAPTPKLSPTRDYESSRIHERYPGPQNYPDGRQTYPREMDYPYGDQVENDIHRIESKSRNRLAERIGHAEHLASYQQRPEHMPGYPESYPEPKYPKRDTPARQAEKPRIEFKTQPSRKVENFEYHDQLELRDADYEQERVRRFSHDSTTAYNRTLTLEHKVLNSHRSMDDIPNDRSTRRTRKDEPPRNNVNYIERNIQTYGRATKGGGYKSMFAKKQEVVRQDNQATSAPSRLPTGKPPLPGISRTQRDDSWDDSVPKNPEQLWAERSKALAKRNQHGKSRPDVSKPRHMVSNPELSSRNNPSKRTSDKTTDPQRVSIDLNLKLITPQGFHIADGTSDMHDRTSQPLPDRLPIEQINMPQHPTHYIRPYADPYVLDKAFKSPRDLILDERTPSDIDRIVYATTAGNPFTPLPPIKREDEETQSEPPPQNGYLAQYHRDQDIKKGNVVRMYKPYSLHDYKRMQKAVNLGGLGPDMDGIDYREKIERRLRAEEYARQAHERNLENLNKAKSIRSQPVERQREVFSPGIVLSTSSKRQAALDYAKKVQKHSPVITSPQNTTPASPNLKRNSERKPKKPQAKPKLPEPELIDLNRLLERHQRDKENVAAMRANMLEGKV